jgi:hypothetical protein
MVIADIMDIWVSSTESLLNRASKYVRYDLEDHGRRNAVYLSTLRNGSYLGVELGRVQNDGGHVIQLMGLGFGKIRFDESGEFDRFSTILCTLRLEYQS